MVIRWLTMRSVVMRSVWHGIVIIACLLLAESADAQANRGRLFIIGGGKRPPEMMKQFVDLAGGPAAARIVVIPNASSAPETTGMEQAEQFRQLGVRSAEYLLFSREEAMGAAHRLDSATGIFFSGGDQSRLTRDLLHTPVHRKLLELYARGAVIGGTSAGAAVMSKVMITGDELLNPDSTNAFSTLKKGNVVTAEGFGFLSTMIVDQHFVRRKRHNRLISLVLENPSLIGVGIDEATAVVIQPDSMFIVTGDGQVVVFDARGASSIHVDRNGNLSAAGVAMHLLSGGDRFDARTGLVLQSREK